LKNFPLILIFIFACPGLLCQVDSLNSKTIRREISLDPDSYAIVVSRIGEKWNNKIGGEYDFDILTKKSFTAGASLGGFLNVHNFDKGQELSWQLWRGSMGISTFCCLHNSDLSARLWDIKLRFSWVHESQHATDLQAYIRHYILVSGIFNNAIARSFEYFRVNADYLTHFSNDHWQFVMTLGFRYYPKPLGYDSQRILRNSLSFETGIERIIYKRFYQYFRFYDESINNAFVAAEQNYKGDWSGEPFRYRMLETGIGNRNPGNKILNVFLFYTDSNGRGLDFTSVSKTFGWGLRIVL